MKIGKITKINYSDLTARVSTDIRGNSVNIRGTIYYFGNIGGYLKVSNAVNEDIVCEVTAILDTDPNKEGQSFNIESERELILKPIGTKSGDKFNLGVGIYPSLYSDVSIITYEELEVILSNADTDEPYPEIGDQVHKTFELGTSKSLIDYPMSISINKFFSNSLCGFGQFR